jgi:chromate transporter
LAAVFLKLGVIGFGGPAAHIALMRDELVTRRGWVNDREFVDLLGATNLIPGPNSTEMAIHLGFSRAGWRGLIVGGTCFILPAFAIVLAFAWGYERYGGTPEVTWLLHGVKPVIIAIVVQALWGLSRTALRGPLPVVVAGGVFALYLLGVNEIALLFGGALLVLLLRNGQRLGRGAAIFVLAPAAGAASLPLAASTARTHDANLWTLFLTFLKIGAVLYGSGYVLLAFLRNDFVERLGWITNQQLLDAVAVGQVTPGPVFTTATFIGYIVAGFPGAILATTAIFLPSFVFVAALNPIVPRLRASPVMSSLLDGVNASALGLMAAVTCVLGRDAIVDWWTALLAAGAAVALLRFRVPSVWLIAAGAAAGLARYAVAG